MTAPAAPTVVLVRGASKDANEDARQDDVKAGVR
jgi:hypothetical protein